MYPLGWEGGHSLHCCTLLQLRAWLLVGSTSAVKMYLLSYLYWCFALFPFPQKKRLIWYCPLWKCPTAACLIYGPEILSLEWAFSKRVALRTLMESGHDVSIDWACHLSGDKLHYTCPNLILSFTCSPRHALSTVQFCAAPFHSFYPFLLTLFNTNFLKLLDVLWRS